MKKLAGVHIARSLLVLSLITLLALVGCSKGGGGGSSAQTVTVTMDASSFTKNNVTYTIKVGQALDFVDPASSGGPPHPVLWQEWEMRCVPDSRAERVAR